MLLLLQLFYSWCDVSGSSMERNCHVLELRDIIEELLDHILAGKFVTVWTDTVCENSRHHCVSELCLNTHSYTCHFSNIFENQMNGKS